MFMGWRKKWYVKHDTECIKIRLICRLLKMIVLHSINVGFNYNFTYLERHKRCYNKKSNFNLQLIEIECTIFMYMCLQLSLCTSSWHPDGEDNSQHPHSLPPVTVPVLHAGLREGQPHHHHPPGQYQYWGRGRHWLPSPRAPAHRGFHSVWDHQTARVHSARKCRGDGW